MPNALWSKMPKKRDSNTILYALCPMPYALCPMVEDIEGREGMGKRERV